MNYNKKILLNIQNILFIINIYLFKILFKLLKKEKIKNFKFKIDICFTRIEIYIKYQKLD